MSETKTTYEHKNLPAQLITVTSGTTLVRQVLVQDAESVDIVLTVTEHKKGNDNII